MNEENNVSDMPVAAPSDAQMLSADLKGNGGGVTTALNNAPWTLPHWEQSNYIGRRAETVQMAIDLINASQTLRWRGAIANAIVNLAARFGPDEQVQVHYAEGDEGVMVTVNRTSLLDTN